MPGRRAKSIHKESVCKMHSGGIVSSIVLGLRNRKREELSSRIVLLICIMCLLVAGSKLSVKAADYGSWVWPVEGNKTISQGFSLDPHEIHRAIDITAPIGTTIRAAKAGTVVKVVNDCSHIKLETRGVCKHNGRSDGGNQVEIKHADGTFSSYAHMVKGSVCVSEGQTVVAGQKIGELGVSGFTTGAHLHFGISAGGTSFWDGTWVDPQTVRYVDDINIPDISVSFENVKASEITQTSAKIYAKLSSAIDVTERGFYLGTTKENMKRVEQIDNIKGCVDVSYTVGNGSWYSSLSPATTYYFQLYVVAGGETFKTSIMDFTTISEYESCYPLADGKTYYIKSVLSGKVIEVPNGDSTESIQLKMGTEADYGWQHWICKQIGDGYIFVNEYTGQAMDVNNNGTSNGTELIQYRFNLDNANTKVQRFKLININGKYAMENLFNGLAVDIAGAETQDGAELQFFKYHGKDNQLWEFIPVDSDPVAFSPVIDGKVYYIRSVLSGKVIEVPNGDSTESIQLKMGTEADYGWQHWICKQIGDGYIFVNEYTGQAMDVNNNGTSNGTELIQYRFNLDNANTKVQKFRLINNNGKYAIVNMFNGLAIDIAGAETQDGAALQFFECHGKDNQLWEFIPIDNKPPTVTNVRVSDVDCTGYTVWCDVTDDDSVSYVSFPTWSDYNGQDDIGIWPVIRSPISGNTYCFRVNISEHNFDFGAYTTHIYAYDSYGKYAVGGTVANVSHSYKDTWSTDGTKHWHECTACEAKKDEAGHNGGKATCTEKAKCEICGVSYGKLATHSYNDTWTTDGTKHWHECTACGAKKDEAGHSGGTATCKEKGKCKICNKSYGNLGAHNYSTSWTTDSKNHWHECSRCHDKKDEVAHTLKTSVTPATLSIAGKSETSCSVCKEVIDTKTIDAIKTVKLSATVYVYDGKTKNPKLTVKDSAGKTIPSTYYTVKKSKGCKEVGKYTYKITFKGNYKGTKSLTFTINPKGTTLVSVKAESKGFTVKWKKQATQTTGYEIRYATNQKMDKAKTVKITKNSETSKKITKLAAKKKYYVQVRTYKKIGSKTYYSDWSKTKTVTTKK